MLKNFVCYNTKYISKKGNKMKKGQKIIKIIGILIIILFILYSNCYAAIAQVTKESLSQEIQNVISNDESDLGISQVNVGDNTISVNYNNQELEMQYDLSNEPTFSFSFDVQQGMTSLEYSIQNQNIGIIVVPYIAIASLNNVIPKEALLYYAMTEIESAGGINIDSSINSQIDNNIIEYLKSVYGEPQIYNDKQYGNTYELTTELQDVTATSCRVKSTIKINLSGDFTKIHKYVEMIKNSFQGDQNNANTISGEENSSIVHQNVISQNDNNQISGNKNLINNETAKTQLTKTGINIALCVILGIVIVFILIFGIKCINFKNVK